MESSLLKIIFSGIFNILVAAATAYVGRFPIRKNARIVREKQLQAVYLPLEKLLQSDLKTKRKLTAAKRIVSDNYLIFPPQIRKKIYALDNDPNPDLRELEVMVRSYFEWTRRNLNYPYDIWAIIGKYTPFYDRRRFHFLCCVMIFLFVASFCGYVFTEAYFKGNNWLNLSDNVLIGAGCIGFAGIIAFLGMIAWAIVIAIESPRRRHSKLTPNQTGNFGTDNGNT